MNQRDVAKALGISRTWLQVLERRALQKVAEACGGIAPETPAWQRQYQSETRTPEDKAYRAARKRRLRVSGRAA